MFTRKENLYCFHENVCEKCVLHHIQKQIRTEKFSTTWLNSSLLQILKQHKKRVLPDFFSINKIRKDTEETLWELFLHIFVIIVCYKTGRQSCKKKKKQKKKKRKTAEEDQQQYAPTSKNQPKRRNSSRMYWRNQYTENILESMSWEKNRALTHRLTCLSYGVKTLEGYLRSSGLK